MLLTQLITLNYTVVLSHRRSTTVSLETNPLLPRYGRGYSMIYRLELRDE